jgi:hypothetical protein
MDSREELDEIISEPLDDKEMKMYLPDAPLLVYGDLRKYKNIEELLPENKSCCILLYQESPNKGHWVVVVRDGDEYLYFDSYGKKIDDPLNWVDLGLRKELNQSIPYLSKLLEGKPHKYNNKQYQENNIHQIIATCGRHCIFFVLNNRMNNLDLETYKKLMENLRKKTGQNYDEIVSEYISV